MESAKRTKVAGTGRIRLGRRAFLVPSFITVCAFFAGFLAIISAYRGDYEYAVKCIAASFLLDGLDGRVARRLNATSAFGREFDSISDVVAFGAAPALLVYCWALSPVADQFGIVFAFLFLVCGGARLARFNVADVETGDAKKHFVGLPIPAGAAAICALVYFHPAPITNISVSITIMLYTLALAALMVSTIPFFSPKHFRLTERKLKWSLLALSIVVPLAWYQSRAVILAITLLYVASGPIMFFIRDRRTPNV